MAFSIKHFTFQPPLGCIVSVSVSVLVCFIASRVMSATVTDISRGVCEKVIGLTISHHKAKNSQPRGRQRQLEDMDLARLCRNQTHHNSFAFEW